MTPTAKKKKALPFDALTVPLDSGVTMVEASAGTGKTFAITRLVLRFLLEKKVDSLSQLLVVTFTEKATQELVTRVRATLRLAAQVWSDAPPVEDEGNADLFKLRAAYPDGREIVERALGTIDELAVSTIHGFCHRMLAESALESGIPFRTTFIEDATEPLARAAADWVRKRLLTSVPAGAGSSNAELFAGDAKSLRDWVRDLVIKYRQHPGTLVKYTPGAPDQELLADFVKTVNASFEAEKTHRHLLGFDDLLQKLAKVLSDEGSDGPLAHRIRSRFKAALIDEFQDTDQAQYSIFSLAFAGCPLFFIGDPKQSIYAFRGADIAAYLTASATAARKYTLLKNYRSTPAYVAAVTTLFTRAEKPFRMDEGQIDFPEVTAAKSPPPPGKLGQDGCSAMEWWWVNAPSSGKSYTAKDAATRALATSVANEAVRLHAEGLPCGKMAVLVRTNEEARQFKKALDRARIPAVIGGDADVLSADSDEANELALLAAAIAAPTDAWAVRAAMSTRLWGSRAGEIAETLRPDGEALLRRVTGRLAEVRDLWRREGIAVALGKLLDERGAAERLLALSDGMRRMTNVRHIVELFHEAWAVEGVAPEGFAGWLAAEREVTNTPDRRELRLETDSQAVQVLTIHKAKGLEFDVVFCPTLWNAPDPRPGPLKVMPALVGDKGTTILDLGSADYGKRLDQAERERAEEGMRLAYVALTRAVHRCYVGCGEIGEVTAASGQLSATADSSLGYLLRGTNGETSQQVLDALVRNSNGSMAVRAVPPRASVNVSNYEPAVAEHATALILNLAPGQLTTWRVSSFSGMTANVHDGDTRDVTDEDLVPRALEVRAPTAGFRGFPAGTHEGNALHDMFEQLDFAKGDDAAARTVVERCLEQYALTGTADIAAQRADDVGQMLRTVSGAPIPGSGFALSDIPRKATLREWRFDMSAATISTRRIADVFAEHGSAHARAYAPLLRTLKDSAVAGYLTGFIDLAFEHQGRWWLVDWKSNQLGPDDADYAPDRLSAAMHRMHYTLQYHLYLVALHRHLTVRQPGYDSATCWGGVAYVFLRGVTGAGDHGWFRDTPTPALLDALDAALGRRS